MADKKTGNGKTQTRSKLLEIFTTAFSRMGSRFAEQVTEEFEIERKSEAEKLANAFIRIVNEQKPTIETTLYVLRQLEFELLLDQHHAVVNAPGVEAHTVLAGKADHVHTH